MDGMFLVIGTLIALAGLISLFLIWKEQKISSRKTFSWIDGFWVKKTQASGKPVPEEIQPGFNEEGGYRPGKS